VLRWRLIKSGPLDPITIHAIYEAIAESVSRGESPNTLHICWPEKPYVCIGIHQILDFEVNVRKCRELGIPILRRQVGGGATYLDSNQFFYHIIVRKEDAPINKSELFRRYLAPTICTYRRFGINAVYRPLNDVVVDGKKVSGNGAGTFGNAVVVIGNVILDFNPEMFVSVLRIPSEKMRDKMVNTIDQWVSSLKKELGYKPSMDKVMETYISCFEEEFGVKFVESGLTNAEKALLDKLRKKYTCEKWMYRYKNKHHRLLGNLRPEDRIIKILGNHYIIQIVEKPEKLMRIIMEVKDGAIRDIVITGDFFIDPILVAKMENFLKDMDLREVLSMDTNAILSQLEIEKHQREAIPFIENFLKAFSKLRDIKEIKKPL